MGLLRGKGDTSPEEKVRQLEQSLLETIETLNDAVEARDPYTAGHSQRVRRFALALGRALELTDEQLAALETAALFHDIGKIGMPDSILTKPDRLTRDEQTLMREHVTRGAEMVSKVPSFREAAPGIRYHHERWDGLGYPEGLSGEQIPLEAAIIGLADAWDTMTSDRGYERSGLRPLALTRRCARRDACRARQAVQPPGRGRPVGGCKETPWRCAAVRGTGGERDHHLATGLSNYRGQ
jgi:putative nucleotidyltransferase with HDIG domain